MATTAELIWTAVQVIYLAPSYIRAAFPSRSLTPVLAKKTLAPFSPLPLNIAPFGPIRLLASPRGALDGTSITLRTGHGTGYSRSPFGKAVPLAGMWGLKRKVGKHGFEVRCEVNLGRTAQQSAQAGLVVQLSPTERVKVGEEYDQGKIRHTVELCDPYSARSILPHSLMRRFTISYYPTTASLRVYRGPTPIPASATPPTSDTPADELVHESRAFGFRSLGSNLPPDLDLVERLGNAEVTIGMMGCSPLGSDEGDGAECTFAHFEMRDGVKGAESPSAEREISV